jgi:putative redox protein
MNSETTSLSVTTRSVEGAPFTQVIEAGEHRLTADRPVMLGGNGLGPGPYSYLLAALGA